MEHWQQQYAHYEQIVSCFKSGRCGLVVTRAILLILEVSGVGRQPNAKDALRCVSDAFKKSLGLLYGLTILNLDCISTQ